MSIQNQQKKHQKHSTSVTKTGLILKQPILPMPVSNNDIVKNKIFFTSSSASTQLNTFGHGAGIDVGGGGSGGNGANGGRNVVGYNGGVKNKEEDKMFFDANPVIVARRNISTAQNKNHDYQDDEQDLIFTSNPNRKKQSQQTYTSHFTATVRDSMKKAGQRPQSKQQPRTKGWSNSEMLIKSSIIQNDRPQTSKGQRPKNLQNSNVSGSRRKISLGNQDSKVNNMMENNEDCKDGGDGKKNIKTSRLFFKTSIDSEFLSLFAN